MYAIIETGGRQFWVVPGERVTLPKLEAKEGAEVSFDALWAVGDAAEGAKAPISQKGKVTAAVVKHKRGPKIIVFKRRMKKAYRKTQGHRQDLTEVLVKTVSLN